MWGSNQIDWLIPSVADASRPWNWYSRKDQGGAHWGFGLPIASITLAVWSSATIVRPAKGTAIPFDRSTQELKPVDADDTCMLMLELAMLLRFVSVLVPSRGGHWIEVYGDRGTLVLVVTIRKITFIVFASGQPQRDNPWLQIPAIIAFLKLTPMVALHRLSG